MTLRVKRRFRLQAALKETCLFKRLIFRRNILRRHFYATGTSYKHFLAYTEVHA